MFEILVAALTLFAPRYMDEAKAKVHVEAALLAEMKTNISADLLLSMAYLESRYNPDALSRRQCKNGECKRETGYWKGDVKPRWARPSWYCGVLQVGGYVPWEECVWLRKDIKANYMTSAIHLRWWTRIEECRGSQKRNLQCALQGYGGGYRSIRKGRTRYANHVIRTRERFSRFVVKVSTPTT